MYRYRYINKHFQFGETSYSLILEDLEGGMPLVRIEKIFKLDPSLLDDDYLYTEASKEIIAAIAVFNEQNQSIEQQDPE